MVYSSSLPLLMVMLPYFATGEFYSDVDSAELDQKKALEIKAREFWNGVMKSAQYLETKENAKLSAKVDRALEELSEEDNDIRELFHASLGHLAKADAMLFEEAAKFKELARERLDHGPSNTAFLETSSGFENVFYAAYKRFVGGKTTYQERLGRHIISRIKDIKPDLDHAVDKTPQMYEESSKASDKAYEITRSRDDGTKGNLPLRVRSLAYDIISATGKQRLRFTNYLLNSLMTTAEDIAGKEEPPAKTLIRSSIRGIEDEVAQKASPLAEPVQVIKDPPSFIEEASATNSLRASPDGPEPKLFFHDGVPVDAEPIPTYLRAPSTAHVVNV